MLPFAADIVYIINKVLFRIRKRSAKNLLLILVKLKNMKSLNAIALGYTGAILSALGMLIMGILGNLGIYTKAVERMQDWHVFFSLSVSGIVGGMIESAIWSFIIFWIFGWLYNLFAVKNEG